MMLEFLPWSTTFLKDCLDKYNRKKRLYILDVELGGTCNFNCCYCDTPQYMHDICYSLDDIERLIVQGNIEWLFLCGLGEPTAAKNMLHFKRLLSFCGEHNVKCSVFTNLSLFDEELFEYINKGVLYPLFKLDSLKPEVISIIYGSSSILSKRQLLNVNKIVEYVRMEGNATNICASIVPSAYNKDELIDLVDWCYHNNIFPLIGDLEDAGKGQEVYQRLKLEDEILLPLKQHIKETQGVDYQIPICPSVLFGLHINHEGNVVVDAMSGLSCHWFWLTEPVVKRLVNIESYSFDELSRIVIENRDMYRESLSSIVKTRKRLVFGGCGGDVVDLLEFYLKNM